MDYITAFYSKSQGRDNFAKGIDPLLGSYGNLKANLFPIHITPLYWDSVRNVRRGFRLLSQNEGVHLFEFSYHVGRSKQKRTITRNLFTVENPEYQNIYTVIPIGTSASFSKRVLSHLIKAYSWASLTFIIHRRLMNLLIRFRDTKGLELTIVRATNHNRNLFEDRNQL